MGKEFVILTLQVSGSDVTGAISIANMIGDEGQCAVVVAPPSADHAMKVTDAQVKAAVLAFRGSSDAQFEMTLAGDDSARLKFLNTPVEDTPWKLTQSN